MSKIKSLLLISAVLMMYSCGQGKQQVPSTEETDSVSVTEVDSLLYGVCGIGTTMHTLQLVTDDGDTLMLDLQEAQDRDQVKGGIQPGDRMAVEVNADTTAALRVVNLDADGAI